MSEKEAPPEAAQDHERLTNNEMHLKDDILFCRDIEKYLMNACCSDYGCMYANVCEILLQNSYEK